ncbi:SnoaL-like domain-containing protein [Pseudomonas azotifigens]|uniref:SnoaL-like domain-containing protein n=2 Tax=Stutzerimonas azotifigens TaxID=291995 RepID=A0ABR5YV32_9GAMM|nr:SnoaL-like domain-containing protein [Stutzerimonas azotifigens]
MNTATAAGASSCPTAGPGQIGDLHSEWILVGWEKHPGDGPFDFRAKLGKFYDFTGPNVVLYDDFEPQHRVARSASEYGTFWTAPFTAMRSARHRVMDGPDVIAGSDLATSTLEFAARLEAADRAITGIRTRSSLVWQCTAQGWKIVREHNSTRRVDQDEIDSLIPG